MRLTTLFAAFALALLSALGLSAQSVRVIFVTGKAEIQAPGEPALRAVTKGEVVILGTRIVTGADGRVALTPMPGVKSLISPNTDLLLESAAETRAADGTVTAAATLNLKQGSVVTDLLKQEGVTYDYNIRTPRGLAGARGTNYTVSVNAFGIETILVSHGTIIFRLLDGRSLSVAAGQVQIIEATGEARSATTLGELSAEDQALAQDVAESTLSALEAAVDAGIIINPDAISQALDLFQSFGLDTSASILQRINTLKEKLDDLAKVEKSEDLTVVTEQRETARANFQTFIASLTPEQAVAFSEITTLGGFTETDSRYQAFLAKFAQSEFTDDLLRTINLYLTLSSGQKSYVQTLGILGNFNLTAVGTDSAGLSRLLSAYDLRRGHVPTLADEASFTASTSFSLAQNEIFFPGTGGHSGQTLFNGSFGNPDTLRNLYLGATRYFRLSNTIARRSSPNFNVGTGRDVEIRTSEGIALDGSVTSPITFSSGVRGILLDSITLNLANVSFPEGSVVSLTSRDGGVTSFHDARIKVPNFGSSIIGRVNFLNGVYYGDTLLNSDLSFVNGSRGNVLIRSFADGIAPTYPSYTSHYAAFVAKLSPTQATAFSELISAAGLNTTDPLFLARFSDPTFTDPLLRTIDIFASLSVTDRPTAISLGILGNGNTAAFEADSAGLARLLASYTALFNPIPPTSALSKPSFASESAYPAGTTVNSGLNNVFFSGLDGFSGQTIFNGSFGNLLSPADLTIGATRYLRLSNDAAFTAPTLNFNVAPAGLVTLRASDEVSLRSAALPITFSSGVRGILLDSITVNLANVSFPEGSVVSLTSRDGGVTSFHDARIKVPNFGSSVVGRVNFINGVYYGDTLLNSDLSFVNGSRGNILIRSFADGIAPTYPSYTSHYAAFVAKLSPTQATAFSELISAAGFNTTDPLFIARFSDPTFTDPLLKTIDIFASLSVTDRPTAISLGILGNGNTAAFEADSAGLARLLASYTALFNPIPPTSALSKPSFASEGAYPAGTTVNTGLNNVFFSGLDGFSGQTIFNGSFGNLLNPGDLTIGATRFLRLSNDAAFTASNPNFNVAPGGLVTLRAADEVSLRSAALPITFSSGVRGILLDSITVNLANVSFPEGSVVSLTSRDGGVTSFHDARIKVPNFGSSVVGRVNFINGVYYGDTLLNSDLSFVNGSRGNILIRSFADGIAPTYPTYTSHYAAFVAKLSPSQATAFSELISAGGFDTTDPLFLARFADPAFTTPLTETINLYSTLSVADRTTAAALGILGNANTAAIGADSTGLARLLAAYTLLGTTTLPPLSIEDEADYAAGITFYAGANNIFFNGLSGGSGATIYNGVFGDLTSPGSLTIGATRYFRLSNDPSFSSEDTNFNVDAGISTRFISGNGTSSGDTGNTGGDVAIRASDEISLNGTIARPISFGSATRSILMESITLNLNNVNFPEGSVVALNSRDGGLYFGGISVVGGVNFRGGVFYGLTLLDSFLAFTEGARGNIAIGSFAEPATPPTYTSHYAAFVAKLSPTQATAFSDLLYAGGFSTSDPLFLARFADPAFTSPLTETIDLYATLSPVDRQTASTLGIFGNANTAAIGANSLGLSRLITSYTTLFNDEAISTPSLEYEYDYASGTSYNTYSNDVFFPGANGNSGQTIYNGMFGDTINPGDITIGATRFFRLSNESTFSSEESNFNVDSRILLEGNEGIITGTYVYTRPANTGGDVAIRASDEISLHGLIDRPISFTYETRAILMESITLNLNNVDFPEGSVVALNSRDGGLYFGGSSVVGGVNFRGGVFYGENLLDSASAFTSGSRGNIVIGSFANPADASKITYTPVPLTAEQLFANSLRDEDQRVFFYGLPFALRQSLVSLNDPDMSDILLSRETENGVHLTTTSLERYLNAYVALSTDARAAFKALGGATGSGFTNIDGTPDIARWSTAAIESAAANFHALDANTQAALIALGAGDAIVGLNADYIQGLVAAVTLKSSDFNALIEAGWGRFLDEITTDSALADVVDAATDSIVTPAQRATILKLDIDPFGLAQTLETIPGGASAIYSRLDYLSTTFQPADLELLADLGYNQAFELFGSDESTTLANVNAVLAHYAGLSVQQQDAARAMRLSSLLIDNARAVEITDFYLRQTPESQEAIRDTGLSSAFFGQSTDDLATETSISNALTAYFSTSAYVRNYLLAEAEHYDLLPILNSTATNDHQGKPNRTLNEITALLNSVFIDRDTLLDLDIAPAILFSGYLDGTTLTDNIAALGAAVDFYKGLPASEQGTMRALGIIGSDHVGYLGTDYSGVQRLLTAYAALPLPVRVDTQRIDEQRGNGQGYKDHTSYFLPFNKDTGNTSVQGAMVNITFDSPGDLYVGAVRRLRINNENVGETSDTFNGGDRSVPFDLWLQAGDLIDLNQAQVSFNARKIVMDAITINLSNFNFPEGSVAALNSRDGGTADGSTGSGTYPHWGNSEVGRVNFLTNVTYGYNPMDNADQFDANARGNIAIGSHASPASLPEYTPPVITPPTENL